MLSPFTARPTPRWSRCADITTYSFFSLGSEPSTMPTMFSDSIRSRLSRAEALSAPGIANVGSGFLSATSWVISSMVWPVPARTAAAPRSVSVHHGAIGQNDGGPRHPARTPRAAARARSWHGNRRDPNRARFLQREPAFVGGVDVRLHVVRHRHRREGVDVDRDLALQVQALEFVPSGL